MSSPGILIHAFAVNHSSLKSCPLLFVLSLLVAMLGTGCSSTASRSDSPRIPLSDQENYWHGDQLRGSPSIRISLSEQKAYFYKGNELAGVSLISSGREGLDTVTGDFKIIQKDRDHRSSIFGDYLNAHDEIMMKDVDTSKHPMPRGARYEGASMPYFMRIVGGTGMHAGFLPGYADSHGCIRMPEHMAEAFFNAVSLGTPVSIVP